MVDYQLIGSNNWKLPEPDPEEEQEILEPVIDVVYNVYQKKGIPKVLR